MHIMRQHSNFVYALEIKEGFHIRYFSWSSEQLALIRPMSTTVSMRNGLREDK
jgi:hypothetical protein